MCGSFSMPVFSYFCTILHHINVINVYYTKNAFKNPMILIPLLQSVLSLSDLKILNLNPPLTVNQKQPKLAPFMFFTSWSPGSGHFLQVFLSTSYFLNKNEIHHNFVKVSDPRPYYSRF